MDKLPKENSRVVICIDNELEVAYFKDKTFHCGNDFDFQTHEISFWFYEKDVMKMLKKTIKKKEVKSLQRYAAKLILQGQKEKGWGILYATGIIISDPGDEQSHIYLPEKKD